MSATVHVLDDHAITVAAAAELMLARRDLADLTAVAYAETFRRVDMALGDRPMVQVDEDDLADVLAQLWGSCSPGTYNRHRAALSSLWSWTTDRGWTGDNPVKRVERRRARRTRTQEARQRPIPLRALEAIWSDRNHGLRERTLWRMLYETAARANEVLSLNIEDIDRADKSAVTVSKGGDVDRLFWVTGTARLLPHLIADKTSGPLFVAARRPTRPMPTADVDPDTGRARLSYRRAEELWVAASGGHTLHQLRHSALTHLAEQGVDMGRLKAKSRHRSMRSLERYVAPSQESVRKLTDEHDPARRRRS